MDQGSYYTIVVFISCTTAIISVIAAFSTFRFSKAAKKATEDKIELDRSKYKPFFVSKLKQFEYNKPEKRYEGEFVLENAGEVTQRIDRVSIAGSAELVPSGVFIISTPELLEERTLIEAGNTISIKFRIHTWDVELKQASIEVRLNTSNSYLPDENILLKCGEVSAPIPPKKEV